MLTWVLMAVVAWVLLSVPLALLVGAALEHGERVPRGVRRGRLDRRPASRSVRLAGRPSRLAS
jgi:hypothetical protein